MVLFKLATMFQNLRVGGKLYILHKDGEIRIDEADITSVSMPTMRFFPQNQFQQQAPMYVVDISTKVGDVVFNFPQVPANMDIVDYGNNGNIVISSNADAIAMELSNIKRKSEDAIASIDNHKSIIAQCDKALSIVKPNPISDENEALRSEIAEMRKLLMEQKKMFDNIKEKPKKQ